MKPALISIIIAGTGNDSNLRHCLDQAIVQSYPNLEIIVVSPQPAPSSWLQDLATHGKIKLLVSPKANENDLYRTGVLKAKGEYLTFQNSLEFFLQQDSLEKLMSTVQRFNADFTISPLVHLKNGKLLFKFPEVPSVQPLNTNNYLRYAQTFESFRTLSGSLIQRQLLSVLGFDQLTTLSPLAVNLALCRQAQNPYFFDHFTFVWELTSTHPLPVFNWESAPAFSPLSALIKAHPGTNLPTVVSPRISIALGVDAGVSDALGPLLFSIGKNCTTPVDVYVIYEQLPASLLKKLTWFNSQFAQLKVIPTPMPAIDRELLNAFKQTTHVPFISAYYRLFLPQLLPHLDRVLYLDADTLVTHDLAELWHYDLKGKFLGVVRDEGIGFFTVYPEQETWWGDQLFGPHATNYFNSGMLLFDLTLWRRYSISLYLYQFVLDTIATYVLDDQDALNLFFHNFVTLLPKRFNYVTKFFNKTPLPLSEITVLHFLGHEKPWRMNFNQPQNQWPAIATYRTIAHKYQQAIAPANQPRVSILLDTDPTTDFSLESIESLLSQDYPVLEIFVLVEEAEISASNSLVTLAKLYDWLTLVPVTGTTAEQRWQAGLAQTNGDFVLFLGRHDRLVDPKVISQLVQHQQNNQADLVSGFRVSYNSKTNEFIGPANPSTITDLSKLNPSELQPYGVGEYQTLAGQFVRRVCLHDLDFNAPDLILRFLAQTPKRIHWDFSFRHHLLPTE